MSRAMYDMISKQVLSMVINSDMLTCAGPDGTILVGPVMDEETLVMAELDLTRIAEESLALDVTGHYSRPDIFQLTVNGSNPFKSS